MKTRSILALSLGLLMVGAMGAQAWASPQAAPAKAPSLYQRLGGYDALAAVTDDFLGRLASDPQLGRFFVGLSTSSLTKTRQHIVDFLCQATGGPCRYSGRSMRETHSGMNLNDAHFNALVEDLVGALNQFNVPEREKTELLNALGGMKGDIVGH